MRAPCRCTCGHVARRTASIGRGGTCKNIRRPNARALVPFWLSEIELFLAYGPFSVAAMQLTAGLAWNLP